MALQNIVTKFKGFTGAVLLAGVALGVVGCSDAQTTGPTPGTSTSVDGDMLDTDVVMPMPESFAGLRAVVLDNVFATLSVNNQPPVVFNQSTQVATSFQVDRGETFTAVIRWFETLPGSTDLLLASYTIEQEVTDSISLPVVDSADYQTEGVIFDRDNDGFYNLEERRANSDPLDGNSVPATTPDVRIGAINPADAPVIDGLYDSIYDTGAQFSDVDGNLLDINHLMIDQGAVRSDLDTEFRWFAMHDNTYLYIFVLGENVAVATPIRDSIDIFQDDSIDIFIDADNSKGSAYDGVDDRHLLIPLIANPGGTARSNSTVFIAGPNSASLPEFDFATCVCLSGQNTWEVRLPLAEFGLARDRPFGIEVQLNEDNDGGPRDAKWGWFHPSRRTVDVDNTFRIPSFMGTGVLN